jgi:hypothetical protein
MTVYPRPLPEFGPDGLLESLLIDGCVRRFPGWSGKAIDPISVLRAKRIALECRLGEIVHVATKGKMTAARMEDEARPLLEKLSAAKDQASELRRTQRERCTNTYMNQGELLGSVEPLNPKNDALEQAAMLSQTRHTCDRWNGIWCPGCRETHEADLRYVLPAALFGSMKAGRTIYRTVIVTQTNAYDVAGRQCKAWKELYKHLNGTTAATVGWRDDSRNTSRKVS